MDDLISRQTTMKEFANFVRESNNSDFAQTPTWNDAVSLVESMPSAQPEPHWIPMSEREPEPGNYLTTFRKRGDPEDKRDVTIDLYWSGGWDDDGIDGDGTVFETLAWMPLPEPYKEGEDE